MPLFKPISTEWINPYKAKPQDLINVYNKLAKRANQRMRALEQKQRKTGKNTTFGAYAKVQMELGRPKDGLPKRFKENVKTFSEIDIRKQMLYVQSFLEGKTSTLSGINELNTQRSETWKKLGLRFGDTKDFYEFLNSGLYKELNQEFDSETIIEIYDRMREFRSDKESMQRLQEVVDLYHRQKKELSESVLRRAVGIRGDTSAGFDKSHRYFDQRR